MFSSWLQRAPAQEVEAPLLESVSAAYSPVEPAGCDVYGAYAKSVRTLADLRQQLVALCKRKHQLQEQEMTDLFKLEHNSKSGRRNSAALDAVVEQLEQLRRDIRAERFRLEKASVAAGFTTGPPLTSLTTLSMLNCWCCSS